MIVGWRLKVYILPLLKKDNFIIHYLKLFFITLRSISITCLFLGYPYLVYQGIESGFMWVAPTLFSGIYLLRSFTRKKIKTKIVNVFISIGLLLGAYYLQTITAKILPVLIQIILMGFFGRTLLKKHQPSLIERFVRLEFPEFPSGISEYCRQLTIIWTLFFALNATLCIILALFGNDLWWVLYNGVFIYLMMGILIIGEYIYRHFRFPDLSIANPIATIKTLVINSRKIWMDVQNE